MPIPKPNKSQNQQEFISSCMGDSVMLKEYKDQKQRAAICYSQWERRKKHKESKGEMDDPYWYEQSDENITFLY